MSQLATTPTVVGLADVAECIPGLVLTSIIHGHHIHGHALGFGTIQHRR
jgi:hypothetical protein